MKIDLVSDRELRRMILAADRELGRWAPTTMMLRRELQRRSDGPSKRRNREVRSDD